MGKLAESTNEACAAPNTPSVQDATAPGIPSYVIPPGGGVITQWSHSSRGISGSLRTYWVSITRPSALATSTRESWGPLMLTLHRIRW